MRKLTLVASLIVSVIFLLVVVASLNSPARKVKKLNEALEKLIDDPMAERPLQFLLETALGEGRYKDNEHINSLRVFALGDLRDLGRYHRDVVQGKVIPVILAGLQSDNGSIVYAAAQAGDSFGEYAEPLIEPLIQLVEKRSRGWDVALETLSSLKLRPDCVIKVIARIIEEENRQVDLEYWLRNNGILAIRDFSDNRKAKSLIPLLEAAMSDNEVEYVFNAAYSLRFIDPENRKLSELLVGNHRFSSDEYVIKRIELLTSPQSGAL